LQIHTTDFNNAAGIITANSATEWAELERVLLKMPLHLKPSGQSGRGGNPVFDPVGTNLTIQTDMLNLNTGWQAPIAIPAQYSSLGTDVDLGKNGMIVEAQFAHYALLLNNTSRAELFVNAGVLLTGQPIRVTVIITKRHMLPSANSSLYYEQAVSQLTALTTHNVCRIPIRLVGLETQHPGFLHATWTQYSGRTSRTVASQTTAKFKITGGRNAESPCRLTQVV
jgi:hypothetical protein